MEGLELHAGEEADPEEEGLVGLLEVALEAAGRLDEGLLEDIGGADPALEAPVQAQLDHAPEAVVVLEEQLRQELLAPLRALQPLEPLGFAHGIRASPSHGI